MNDLGVVPRIGTILFTDLVGFTEYTDVCGDAAAVEVLDQQQAIVGAVLDGFTDCRVVKELGDGLMVWFARVVDGLAAATLILQSITAARDTAGFALNVRMGMHTGEIIERGTDFVGHTVNIASRVSDVAGPGELVVSEGVVRAAAPAASRSVFFPIGPVRVKGVSDPVWLHRLVS